MKFREKDDLLQLFQLRLRNMLRRPSRTEPFQHEAHLIDILNVFLRDPGHKGTLIRDDRNQPFQLQLAQRFTHRRPADAKLFSKSNLPELLMLFICTIENIVPDALKHVTSQ